MAQIFVSGVAHFFVVVGGSKIHERMAHFFIDIYTDLNEQAEDMLSQLVKELVKKEGITETLKMENQMLWVQKMNNLRNAAM